MTAPTLTQFTSGFPWVEVFLGSGDVDASTVTLRYYRYSEGRIWLLRGGVDVAPDVAVLDFGCPPGVQATYRAEQFDVAGVSLGFTDSASTTLNVSGTWVHNPLDPSNGVAVELDMDTSYEHVRPTPGDLVHPEGAGLPRRIGVPRHGVEDLPIVLNLDDQATYEAFDALLGSYATQQIGILCLRTSEPVLWPRTFYISSPQFRARDNTYRYGGQWMQFVASVTEVEPPYPGLSTPLLTTDDLDAAYDDTDLRDAAYSTTTEMDRDYSLAGLASQ
ncbi:hypothetical protein [Agromyces sp. SYSU T00194]|uniref:hypothetical protein n=1 Tax=Agromyces chitinivorans TaxID=3158560 RepID=UPI003393F5AC